MASSLDDNDEIISGINVTPLVDVVLVILIIFIMTASVILRHEIPVDLPKAQSAEETTSGLLNVGIGKDGQVYLNGKAGTLAELPAAVKIARQKAATKGSRLRAFVSADVKAAYGKFARVVDRLRILGVTDIALDTAPEEFEK